MSTAGHGADSPARASGEPVVAELAPSELEEVAAFHARQPLAGTAPPDERARTLRWLLLDNPARAPDIPLGWTLRTATGTLAGTMLCVPQWFRWRDARFRLLLSSAFFVDPAWRGFGMLIFLRYLQLGRRHALFATTASPEAARIWKKLGAEAITGTDRELLGMLRWNPVLEEAAARRVGRRLARAAAAVAPLLRITHRLRLPGAVGTLVPVASAGEAATLFPAADPDTITGAREREFIEWRFYSSTDDGTAVFRYAGPAGDGIVVVKRLRRGYRRQFDALFVIDLHGAAAEPAGITDVAAALTRRYGNDVDGIVFRCVRAAAEGALLQAGFRRRALDAPIGWLLDRHGILPDAALVATPADGDMAV